LRKSTESHQSALERLQGEKEHVQEEVGEAQRGIKRLQDELQHLHELLEEANRNLDGVKRTAGKVQKAHDKAFKEIAGKVRRFA
jgi:predicted  nucleic acid-binding Zn-ribbon protein